MDVRLVQLLGSFIGARNAYVLARLEFAAKHPRWPAPPLIDRLSDPTERALRDEWPILEAQLESAIAFSKKIERAHRAKLFKDEDYRRLERSLRELDQYARAIRWVVTVTEP